MDVDLFDYHLPQSYIAQTPASPRDTSRLLIVEREGEGFEEAFFYQLFRYLQAGDLLVFNNTKVLPARLYGKRKTGGQLEVLLLQEREEGCWEALVKPNRRLHEGETLYFSPELKAQVGKRTDYGGRILFLEYKGDLIPILEQRGELPLPPYIQTTPVDPGVYQTIYAKKEGAVAAPTAGLHFTPRLLQQLKEQGVLIQYLTLHVGLGTFRPVTVKNIQEHTMHAEYYQVEEDLTENLNRARQEGRRIIAVGTTVVRTLETILGQDGFFYPSQGWTDLFIHPGYSLDSIDGLITNFHLPRSTLLMMISAFIPRERLLFAYQYAIARGFRFYSFGDAMLIL